MQLVNIESSHTQWAQHVVNFWGLKYCRDIFRGFIGLILSEIEEIGFFPELLHADLLFSKQSSKQMWVVISNQFGWQH